MEASKLVQQLNWRYATKKFDSAKKISDSLWDALEDSLVLTPSSYGLQPWKFAVVKSSDLKKKLRPHSWDQSQIEDCSHLVVFLSKEKMLEADIDRYIERIAAVRGVPKTNYEAYRKIMIGDVVQGPRSAWVSEWAARQVYIALGNLMTAAAVVSVDACPLEGIDPVKYDEILKMEGYKTRCALALGYRAADDAYAKNKKVRFERSELVLSL